MNTNYPSEALDGLVKLGHKLSAELSTGTFNIHGVKARIVTNSDAATRAIADFLGHFKCRDDDGFNIEFHLFFVDVLEDNMSPVPVDAPLLYDWSMVKVYNEGPRRFLKLDSMARVTADVEQGVGAGFAEKELLKSDWLVTNLFFYPLFGQLLKVNGLFPLHAAGLVKDGKASLFLGRSGSGKSTLSLSLVRGGFSILSDDTVFLRNKDGELEILSFPEEINVKEETIKLLPELSRVNKLNFNELRQKSSFSIEELYPGCIVDASSPSIMVFPQLAESEKTRVEPLEPTEALSESLRYGFFFMDPSTAEQHFQVMALLTRRSRCYRLYSGSDQKELERVVSGLHNGEQKKASSGGGEQ